MDDERDFASVDDLGEPLLTAVQAVRDEPMSDEVLVRIEQRLLKLSPRTTLRSSSRMGKSHRLRFFLRANCVAASVMLAVCLSSFLLRQSAAWAQVVQAVADKPWMRLTLQRPKLEQRADEEFPEVVFWFSGDRKIAAMKQPEELRWLDVRENEEWAYNAKSESIRRGGLDTRNRHYAQLMIAILNRFDAPLPGKSPDGLEVLSTMQDEVVVGDKVVDCFTCIFRDENATIKQQTLVVHVDQESHLPLEMRMLRGQADAEFPPLRFTIDYPQEGPQDIYALGAPRQTHIVDGRDVDPDKYFRARPRQPAADYEAIVFRGMASSPLAWASDAYRFHHNAGGTIVERANPIKLLTLSIDVRENGLGPSRNPPATWWAEQIDRLSMDEFQMDLFNCPHGLCYSPYGGPSDYDSVHSGVLDGLEHTIELRGPKLGVWLDPKRDMIVRRYEQVLDDGSIDVWQCDKVQKGPNGVWFARRSRRGRVEERGAPLDNLQETDGMLTWVDITVIKFQQDIENPE